MQFIIWRGETANLFISAFRPIKISALFSHMSSLTKEKRCRHFCMAEFYKKVLDYLSKL